MCNFSLHHRNPFKCRSFYNVICAPLTNLSLSLMWPLDVLVRVLFKRFISLTKGSPSQEPRHIVQLVMFQIVRTCSHSTAASVLDFDGWFVFGFTESCYFGHVTATESVGIAGTKNGRCCSNADSVLGVSNYTWSECVCSVISTTNLPSLIV